MGPLGVPEMIALFVLALLLLGPKKLPELGRAIGKGMAEFRRASNELRGTFEREMHALEQENKAVKEVTSSLSSTSYDYPYDDYSYSQESTPSQESTTASSDSPPSTSSVSAPQAAEAQPAPVVGASPQPEGNEVKS